VILHRRWRRQAALLAAGALAGEERARAQAHVRGCAACSALLAELGQVRAVLEADPLAAAPLPISLEALETRVRARLREPEPAGRVWRAASPRILAPLAACAVAAAVAGVVLRGREPVPSGPPASPGVEQAAAMEPAGGEELLRRMERTMAREQAARYLTDAQDVLVTVAAGPPPCPKTRETIEVGEESRRSRELLARRALLVELGRDEVASAQPVLAEVEQMLREVAALPSCVRRGRLQELGRRMEERRLLMKIDLMTRELVG
jgi:hypothetical protein